MKLDKIRKDIHALRELFSDRKLDSICKRYVDPPTGYENVLGRHTEELILTFSDGIEVTFPTGLDKDERGIEVTHHLVLHADK